MNDRFWQEKHKQYKDKDWITKPSLFAEVAITLFPATGAVLELGAGQGQDSRFFAEHGYQVISTDLEDSALDENLRKLRKDLKPKMEVQKVDMRDALPFGDATFDIVYAHLALHYFDHSTTARLFDEIYRVLKNGGILAFLVNSIHDPEYRTGEKLEDQYFQIGQAAKRYFSTETARDFAKNFGATLLDDQGETYKDRAKGVHNLIRFIGVKRI